MTYMSRFTVLNPATNKLVGRSRIAIAKCQPNLRADQEAGFQPGESSKEPLLMADKTMQDCLDDPDEDEEDIASRPARALCEK